MTGMGGAKVRTADHNCFYLDEQPDNPESIYRGTNKYTDEVAYLRWDCEQWTLLPQRPEMVTDSQEMLVISQPWVQGIGDDTGIMCAWDGDGNFCQWVPTEQIAKLLLLWAETGR